MRRTAGRGVEGGDDKSSSTTELCQAEANVATATGATQGTPATSSAHFTIGDALASRAAPSEHVLDSGCGAGLPLEFES